MSTIAPQPHPNDGGYEKRVATPPRISTTSSRGGDTNSGGHESRVNTTN